MADRKRQFFGDMIENAFTHNVVLAQALGICPIIAAGVTLKNGVVLTVCTALTMLPLGLLLSLVGRRLAKWLRPVLYVLLSMVLLVAAAMVLERYVAPELYAKLYVFIPLIAVNMLYSRSVGYASTARPLETVTDAIGSSVGFGVVICFISTLREIAAFGTIWDKPLGMDVDLPQAAAPFAAFLLLGFMAAGLRWMRRGIADRRADTDDDGYDL